VEKFSEVVDLIAMETRHEWSRVRAQNVVGLTATFSPCPQLAQSFCVNFVSGSGDSYRFSRLRRLLTTVPSIR
jgi:hypothetical protein